MNEPILNVRFYSTLSGTQPVRDWLFSLSALERKIIGIDIKTVQFGWPLGMPLVRKIDNDLWEVRVHLEGRIARVFFTVHDSFIILLHGFIKKSQITPKDDLRLAKNRLKDFRGIL
jgi:phage-related protein